MNIHPHADMTALLVPHGPHWAIEETAARQYLTIFRATGAVAHVQAFEASSVVTVDAARSDDREYEVRDKIAYLSLTGPMTKSRAPSMSAGTSTTLLRRQLRMAAGDKDVKAIVIRIDSPGGNVSGTADLASDVQRIAAMKPVYAYVEDSCCSAAYWVASQCTKIFSNATALVGSIGTYMVLYDQSKAAESEGVEVLVFSTGPHKGAGVPGSVITEEQRADFQRVVDDLNSHFLAAVGTGRGMEAKAVKSVATGQMWLAADALEKRLIDSICTLDQAAAQIVESGYTARAEHATTICSEDGSPAGLTFAEHSAEVLAANRGFTDRVASMKALKAKDGRSLSAAAVQAINDTRSQLADVDRELSELAEASKPDRSALNQAILSATLTLVGSKGEK